MCFIRRTLLAQAVIPCLGILLQLVAAAALSAEAGNIEVGNPDYDYYRKAPAAIQKIFETDASRPTLNYVSPNQDYFVIPKVNTLSTLEIMSRKTYRLANVAIRPEVNRHWRLDTHGAVGLSFYSLSEDRFIDVELPDNTFVSDLTWSPNGLRLAFLAHLPEQTEVWIAEPDTGNAYSVSDAAVMATIAPRISGQWWELPSKMLQWTPEGTLVTLLVPTNRGAEPVRPAIPASPRVRRTRPHPSDPSPSITPTVPYLLRDEPDALLFEYYTRSQLAELSIGNSPKLIGEPAIYESISVSPDGEYILATVIERPFSYIVEPPGFPHRMLVMDMEGNDLATLRHEPLREETPFGGRSIWSMNVNQGPVAFAWRPDGAGLTYLQRDAQGSTANRPEQIMLLRPPFILPEAEVVAESDSLLSGVTYSLDGRFVFATTSNNRGRAVVYWDLNESDPQRHIAVDFHSVLDPTQQPGSLWTAQTGNGLSYVVMSNDATQVYLKDPGYKADFRPQPFVKRLTLASTDTETIFEGSKDWFEQPIAIIDNDMQRMIVSRESPTAYPDSYLWEGDFVKNLTNNVDPFPEITAAKRIDFSYIRPNDGLEVQARISLPLDYKEGDSVPAVFWSYPGEFLTGAGYTRNAIRTRNHNAFPQLSYLGFSEMWLTQGYALIHPDVPIVGQRFDATYINDLTNDLYGAISALATMDLVDLDRIGHGGHSYGAFTTANLLVHTPYFKAGIAGDGAYNRSLTPTGFQAEQYTLWEAPDTYREMSPFFKANQMDTPLLLYHGIDDQVDGTWPIQSERFIHALTSLGKPAVLYMYHYESHIPIAVQNLEDIWYRFVDWFDQYVKQGPVN